MKFKLRRLFQKAAPNVLSRIMEDCPSPREQEVPAEPKQKHSRFREFVATAAAVALLITMGGGLVWFVGNGGTLAGSNGTTENPSVGLQFSDPTLAINTDPFLATHPENTVGPPVGFTVGEVEAANIALQHAYMCGPEMTVDYFAGSWFFEMQETGYLVTLEHLGNKYEYLISYYGDILDAKVTAVDVMGITQARDAALNAVGVNIGQVSYLKIDLGGGEYFLDFVAADKQYEVTVNVRDGNVDVKNIFSGTAEDWSLQNRDFLNWQAVVEIATKEFGSTPELLSYLKVTASGSIGQPKYEVSVQFDTEPWVYYMQISAVTGEILLVDPNVGASSKPVTPDVPTGILTPEQVLTLAMDYVPEHVKVAYIAGVEGYKGHVEQTAMGDGWCYVTYIVSPEQTWTFLQDRHTGEILGSETDATDCEFKAWSQVGFFGAMEPDELYVLREYDELTKLLDGALPGMFHADLFRERTVLGLCLLAPDSGVRFRISQVLRKADGSYVVSINASRLPFAATEDHWYWTIFAVLEEEIPEGATVSYEITVHTDTYHAVDMDAVNTQYLLPADKVPWTWGTHLQWIRHGDKVHALIDQGSFVYYCEPKTEDVDGDGIPELFLQDSKRIERCLRWDPAQGWFVPG